MGMIARNASIAATGDRTAWEAVVRGDAERTKRRRRMANAIVAMGLIVVLAGVTLIAVPLVARWQAADEQSSIAAQSQRTVASWPYPQAKIALDNARAYNDRLARSGQPVLGEAIDPFAGLTGEGLVGANGADVRMDDSRSSQDKEYQSLLDTGAGVMGSVRVPKISVNMPILHGTSSAVLEQGAGHLYGTSLPVGGPSTHAVLTGHRGLVAALMFTRLDEMREGDAFYIDVMGETIGYRVDRISVIDPNDSRLLRIVPGEDRVTLMTCTPYGVNTHRLLVSGVRAEIPQEIPYPDASGGDARSRALTAAIAAIVLGMPVAWVLTRRGHALAGLWPVRHWAGDDDELVAAGKATAGKVVAKNDVAGNDAKTAS